MAEENEKETSENESGGSKLKLIIIAVVALGILGGGGFAGWTMFLKDKEEKPPELATTDAAQTAGAGAQDPNVFGQIFEMETFVVNLSDGGGKRYLKTKIALEYIANEHIQAELSGRLPQLRDTILLVLSSKNMEEVQALDGKIAIRGELIMRLNQLIKQGRIRNLYFTEFVIQ